MVRGAQVIFFKVRTEGQEEEDLESMGSEQRKATMVLKDRSVDAAQSNTKLASLILYMSPPGPCMGHVPPTPLLMGALVLPR